MSDLVKECSGANPQSLLGAYSKFTRIINFYDEKIINSSNLLNPVWDMKRTYINLL